MPISMYSIISANSHWSLEWILVSLEVICHRPNPVFEGMLLLFRSLISLTPLRIPLKETFGITLNTVFMTLTLACLCKVGYCSLLRNHCYGAQIYSWDETVHIQYWASSSFPGDQQDVSTMMIAVASLPQISQALSRVIDQRVYGSPSFHAVRSGGGMERLTFSCPYVQSHFLLLKREDTAHSFFFFAPRSACSSALQAATIAGPFISCMTSPFPSERHSGSTCKQIVFCCCFSGNQTVTLIIMSLTTLAPVYHSLLWEWEHPVHSAIRHFITLND